MKEEKVTQKHEILDGIEVGLFILTFVFALVFLIRMDDGHVIQSQFYVQNAVNLLMASLLSVILLSLFVSRDKKGIDPDSMKIYIVGAIPTGIAAYLLAVFDPWAEIIWVCLAVGFSGLGLITVHTVRTGDKRGARFAIGMWMVMVISSAVGLGIISVSSIAGLLIFIGLFGAFMAIYGILEIVNSRRPVFDRFSYSASIFSLLMIWLSTSRASLQETMASYTTFDGILVGTGVILGLVGASVLAQRRYLDNRVRKAISKGHGYYKEGEFEKAIKMYEEAMGSSPDSKVARTCKADALAQMKRYEEAVRTYESVIADDREYVPAISGKGSALRQKGELAKSVIYLQKALNLEPDSKIAWNNKGNAFYFLNQLKTAIFCYKKAIEKDAGYSGAWYNLAVSYTNTGKFMEADHAFSTAENLLRQKRRAPRIEKRSSDTGKGVMISPLTDMPQDFDLEILTGDVERRILSHVAIEPGASAGDISLALSIGREETNMALSKLEKDKAVRIRKDGSKKRYYPKERLPVTIHVMEMEGETVKERKVRYLTDLQRDILDLLETEPGLATGEIADRLGKKEQVIGFHLETLERGGLLRQERRGLMKVFHAV